MSIQGSMSSLVYMSLCEDFFGWIMNTLYLVVKEIVCLVDQRFDAG